MFMTVMLYFLFSSSHCNADKFMGANDFVTFQEFILTAVEQGIQIKGPFRDQHVKKALNLWNCGGIVVTWNISKRQIAESEPYPYVRALFLG